MAVDPGAQGLESRCPGTIPPCLVLPLQPLLYKGFAQGTPAVARGVLDDVVDKLDVSCTLRACFPLCRNISTFFSLSLFFFILFFFCFRVDDDDDERMTKWHLPCYPKHFTRLQTSIDQGQVIRTLS